MDRRTLVHRGLEREYFLTLPAGETGGPIPLLLELHGGGGSGRFIDRLGRFAPLGDRVGFAVAAPSGWRRRWNDGRATPRFDADVDDVGFIAAVIDDVGSRAPVDPARVYAVGMSNGAMMVARLASELASRIAAFGQVAGTVGADAARHWNPGGPVPLIQIHGTADPLVPYGGGPVGAGRRRGAFADRGVVLGVEEWIAMVARHNRADGPATAAYPGGVTARAWRGALPASDVEQWRIEGAGHVWPGGPQYAPPRVIGSATNSIDATAVVWRFLAAHSLPATRRHGW